MSGLKGVMKDGWHPKGKDGGKESWRGDFKGINQVAGWMGKGKKPGEGGSGGSDHISRPLATLKDPSLFGPPPKNVNYHGGIALPNEVTPHRGGLGAPLTQSEIESARSPTQQEREAEQREEEEAEKRAGPPLPYRANTTGLKTDHLPPPPVHRAIAEGPSTPAFQPSNKPGPNLPPRLPSRKDSSTTNGTFTSGPVAPPPTQEPVPDRPVQHPIQQPVQTSSWLNQSAMNRLGKAGVTVPALGIGEPNPWKSEKSQSTSPPAAAAPATATSSGLNELQSRFARMNSGTSASPQSPPTEGTTFEQKQAAIKTAQNFHKDPSSVTMADAQSAAITANNFRARHQDQIAAGAQKANGWNKKYNVTGRVNSFLEKQASPAAEQPQAEASSPIASPPLGNINRKPPPPPPPKKPSALHAPPPVPIGTKPSFG